MEIWRWKNSLALVAMAKKMKKQPIIKYTENLQNCWSPWSHEVIRQRRLCVGGVLVCTEDWRLAPSVWVTAQEPASHWCRSARSYKELLSQQTQQSRLAFFFISHRLRSQSDRTALWANLCLVLSLTLHFVIDFRYRRTLHLFSAPTSAF